MTSADSNQPDGPLDPLTHLPVKPAARAPDPLAPSVDRAEPLSDLLARFPWWLLALIAFIAYIGVIIVTDVDFNQAFVFISRGLSLTVIISLAAYAIAMVLGLLAGLLRVSTNVVLNNIGTLYVEFVRGIPMLVLIFFIALVAVPNVVDVLHNFGVWLQEGKGVPGLPEGQGIPNFLAAFENQDVPMVVRAVIALAVTYGAFLAEIFRAGIQSIGRGQMEAARSLGMSYGQAMRYIILPQAIRNVLPALGNDFVAMVKDSSLASVLAVREITQLARLYAGRTFRFTESYVTLMVLYLSMTLLLSLALRLLERRLRSHG